DVTPSQEDIITTMRLKECGLILGIDLLDHIIIGDNRFTSLVEAGYFDEND
ncbi:JAB domain-containing protein, partial [Staphylococcus aureus]